MYQTSKYIHFNSVNLFPGISNEIITELGDFRYKKFFPILFIIVKVGNNLSTQSRGMVK